MYLLPGAGLVGIATSRGIGSHARRNRIKRRIREAVRSLSDHTQFDLVIAAKQSAAVAPFVELRGEVQRLSQEVIERWENESACS